jgi:pyruvate dehydrogenase E1 component alpha subunit
MAPSRSDAKVAVRPELVAQMFTTMVTARIMEELFTRHIRDHGFAGYYHPGIGQEAAPAGATAALRTDDYLWYQGRGVAWAIGKGMAPAPIFGDLLGRVTGATGGKGGGVPHWADPALGIMGEGATLGSVYPLAAGSALAAQLRGSDQVALADFGDGTAGRGTFHETLLQAAVWKLPLVYFCENNGYSVSTPFAAVSPTPHVADRAAAYAIPGVAVDGHDAMAVYQATHEAVERARSGEGPSLVEAMVTRVGGHWEGDPAKYRPEEYLASYRDPIEVFRPRLDAGQAGDIEKRVKEAVLEAFDAALAAPYPDPDLIYRDVYA